MANESEEGGRSKGTPTLEHHPFDTVGDRNQSALDGFAWATAILAAAGPTLVIGSQIRFSAPRLPLHVSRAVLGIIRDGPAPSEIIEYCRGLLQDHQEITIFNDMDVYFQATGNLALPQNVGRVAAPHFMLATKYLDRGEPWLDTNFRFFEVVDHTGKRCCVYATFR